MRLRRSYSPIEILARHWPELLPKLVTESSLVDNAAWLQGFRTLHYLPPGLSQMSTLGAPAIYGLPKMSSLPSPLKSASRASCVP